MPPSSKSVIQGLIETAVAEGRDWRAAIWDVRGILREIEEAYVQQLFTDMEAKVGPLQSGEGLKSLPEAFSETQIILDELLKSIDNNT